MQEAPKPESLNTQPGGRWPPRIVRNCWLYPARAVLIQASFNKEPWPHLLLVDENLLEYLSLIANSAKNFLAIHEGLSGIPVLASTALGLGSRFLESNPIT